MKGIKMNINDQGEPLAHTGSQKENNINNKNVSTYNNHFPTTGCSVSEM